MLHRCFHNEKERENICPKCPLELLFSNFFNRILRVLFGRVVYNDIESAKFLYRLRDSFLAKFFLAHIAFNEKAFTPVFLHQTLGFIRILLFFEVND